MIKVIAFDYADVIAPGPLSKWIRENLVPDEENLDYKKNIYKWDTGRMTLNELYEVLERVTGTPADLIWKKFYEDLQVDTEIIEIIKKLKQNYKIFLFSNFHGELLRKLLEKQKIDSLFDEIIISSEYKVVKPDPEFFNILMRKAEVEKNEILFIDDKLKNIESAKKLGINTSHFQNSLQLKSDLEKVGVIV